MFFQATFSDFYGLTHRKTLMHQDFRHIFRQLKKHDRAAQKAVFDLFSSKMLAVARTYTGNREDAEDVLTTAFLKCFSKAEDCRDEKLFPFWLRKIVINESISYIRRNRHLLYQESENIENVAADFLDEDAADFPDFDVQDVLSQMPLGYRLVFNLYVFEDKKHQEISQILNISEGTSKSQLNKAKKWLQQFFKNADHERNIKK